MKPVTPTKISKGSEIKVNLKKEINLEEVAEDLKKIINDLSKDTDIIKLGEELRNILLDIYTFINKKEKNEKQEEKINRKESVNSQENEKSLEKNNSLNDIGHGKVVNLDKDAIRNDPNLNNSCKSLPGVLESPLVEKLIPLQITQNMKVK